MVSALGQADSFNSSGATIVPDKNERGPRYPTRSRLSGGSDQSKGIEDAPRSSLKSVPSFVSKARMLMPEDSFGRELDALVNGNHGDDGSAANQDWSFSSGFGQSGESLPSGSQPIRELTFSQLLHIPSSPPAEASDTAPIDADMIAQFQAQFSPDTVDQFGNARDDFRLSSANSNSASEYSFTSTDVDNDSIMSESGPQLHGRNDQLQDIDLDVMNMGAGPSNQGHHFWLPHPPSGGITARNGGQVKSEANWDELRTVAPDSVSPAEVTSSAGPIRGNSEDASKTNRLEHRRQINRKSAQKHRKRRKEELEELAEKVAERDHKIAKLERELAVEKAKIAQLLVFMKDRGNTSSDQGPAW